jgi:hypothetical protein
MSKKPAAGLAPSSRNAMLRSPRESRSKIHAQAIHGMVNVPAADRLSITDFVHRRFAH